MYHCYMNHLTRLKESLKKPYDTLNRIELSQSALDHNVQTLAGIAQTELIPILKSNAYGHGLREIAQMLEGQSLPYIGVDGYFEALQARDVSSHNILVMGGIAPSNFANIKTDGFTFVVFNDETIERLGSLGRTIEVHLEIDTGMRRHGVRPEQLDQKLQLLKKFPSITVTGVMSHLADADNPSSQDYSKQQAATFDSCVEQVRAAGFTPQWIHLGQSAGLSRSLSRTVNASRPGIALYGINPLESQDEQFETLQQTKPVLSFYSKPSAIQQLKKGDSVSYGLTFTAPNDMTIAVLPVGYYEILPRSISGSCVVRLNTHELPQIGRICMNHCMIDTKNQSVDFNSEFELISRDRTAPNSLASVCENNNVFAYEMLVNISDSTRRIVIA